MHNITVMTTRGHSGFALLEVLAALTVLAIAGLGIFYIGTTTTRGNVLSENEVAALSLAVDKLEALKNKGFENLDTAGSPYADPSPLTAGGVSQTGAPFTRSWTIASATLNGLSAKRLGVTVSWSGGGGVTLTTEVVQAPAGAVGTSTAFVKDWTQLR